METMGYLLLFDLLSVTIIGKTGVSARDYCSGQSLKAECAKNQVVLITYAQYGRMQTGTCLKKDSNYTSCGGTDVMDIADRMCSGKQNCEIRIVNSDMDKKMTCNTDFTRYLSAEYTCVQVLRGDTQCGSPLRLHSTLTHHTHVSSLKSRESGCGLTSQPYVLQALEGQTVQVTLLDFSPLRVHSKHCAGPYGEIVDLEDNSMIPICRGVQRRHAIYTSSGHKLKITLTDRAVEQYHFMLEMKVLGCHNIIAPKDAWMKRSGNKVVVGCHSYRQTWHLTCDGHQWRGVIGNCTRGADLVGNSAASTGEHHTLSHGMSILIIALASVLISAVIVTVGVMCLKRSHVTQHDKCPPLPPPVSKIPRAEQIAERGRYMYISETTNNITDPNKPSTYDKSHFNLINVDNNNSAMLTQCSRKLKGGGVVVSDDEADVSGVSEVDRTQQPLLVPDYCSDNSSTVYPEDYNIINIHHNYHLQHPVSPHHITASDENKRIV